MAANMREATCAAPLTSEVRQKWDFCYNPYSVPAILVKNPRPATKPATREKNPRPATKTRDPRQFSLSLSSVINLYEEHGAHDEC